MKRIEVIAVLLLKSKQIFIDFFLGGGGKDLIDFDVEKKLGTEMSTAPSSNIRTVGCIAKMIS